MAATKRPSKDYRLQSIGERPDVIKLLSYLKERLGSFVTKVLALDLTWDIPNVSIALYVTGPNLEQINTVNQLAYPGFDEIVADHDGYPCVLYQDLGVSEDDDILNITDIYNSVPKLDVMSLSTTDRLQYFIENTSTLKVIQYLRTNYGEKVKRLYAVDYRREFEGQEVFYVVVGLTHTEVDLANAELNPNFTEELADEGIYTTYLVWSDNAHQGNFLDITSMLKES